MHCMFFRVYFAVLMLTSGALAATYKVTTEVTPSPVIIGGEARWAVNFSTKDAASIPNPAWEIPTVDGVLLQQVGNRVSANMINGNLSTSVSYQFRLFVKKEGSYRIPEFRAVLGNETVVVPATTFEVTATAAETPANEASEIYLTTFFEKDPIYVGQCVPTRLELIVAPSVVSKLRGLADIPMKEGDTYFVQDFKGEPKPVAVQKDGKEWQELVWRTLVTPLKAGAYPLSFYLDAVIAVRRTVHEYEDEVSALLSHALLGGFQQEENRRIRISSPAALTDVRPLPDAGKPKDFSGAIGHFTLSAAFTEKSVHAGDPVSFIVTVEGEGNLSKLSPPAAPSSPQWKCYAPKGKFQASDNLGYAGKWIVEYLMVPQGTGVLPPPPVTFSYFDPDAGLYTELDLPAGLSVKVLAAAQQTPSAVPAPVVEQTPKAMAPLAVTPPLNEPRLLLGMEDWSKVEKPILQTRWFWPLQCLVGLVLGAWWAIRVVQLRHHNDPHYAKDRQHRHATQQYHRQAESCAKQGDAQGFYVAAHRAIQFALGNYVETDPEALTWDEIDAILVAHSINQALREAMRHIVDTHEHWQYAPVQPSPETLKEAFKQLQMILKALQ